MFNKLTESNTGNTCQSLDSNPGLAILTTRKYYPKAHTKYLRPIVQPRDLPRLRSGRILAVPHRTEHLLWVRCFPVLTLQGRYFTDEKAQSNTE